MKPQQHTEPAAVGDTEDVESELTPLLPGKQSTSCFTCIFEKVAADTGLDSLAHHFGYKLLIMLFASQHLMKGFVASFVAPSTQFLYASYKIPGPQMQIFGAVAQLPWAMKPMIGLVSDAFPIRGMNKAPYILAASVLGIAACATIGAVPQSNLAIERLVACLFLMQMQFSTCDLLTEAKYAEKMQSNSEHGPALMTFVWFGLQAGGLFATAMIGPIINHHGPKVPYLLSVLPLSFIVVPIARNYLEEKVQSDAEVAQMRRRIAEQKEACWLCGLMFAGTIFLIYLGIHFHSSRVNAVGALAVAVVLLVAFSVLLRPTIAKVNAFFLIQTSCGVSIGGASFYFYTDTAAQYPEGPHFSTEFYTSVLGIAGSVCSLVGIMTYQRYASTWSYRGLLMVSNIALSVLSLSDVVLFTRLNVRLGLPDHLFVLGSSVLTSVIGQWMWMPGIVILSQLCPKGMEATMYALLAGCHNLGNTIASTCGAWVLEVFNCQPSGADNESEQFKNLWVASLLSTVLPTLTLVLIPWLIPNVKQTDKLLSDEDTDATSGSLWKRWTSHQD